jgi:beta-N-acetylhexosaminidase
VIFISKKKKKIHHRDTETQSKRGKKQYLFCSVVLFLAAILFASPASAQDDLLNSMTLEQKVGQMFIVNLFGGQMTEAGRDFLREWQPGGVVLIGENLGTPEAVNRLTNSFQQTITEAGGLPLLVAVDQEPGPISHLKDGFTQFPTPTLITATGDPQLAFQVGEATADELLAVGVNMNLSPIADLETNRNNPIIRRRSFGSDPAMVSPILAGYVEGLQAGGVLATAKHFPGHGDSSEDSHTGLPVIDLSRERLESVELAPFRAAISADVAVIMVAHIWYPALEPEPNTPASLSPNVVTELLRDELGYEGLIVTDAMDMDAIDTVYSYPDATIKAIQAGVDLVIAAHISEATQAQAIQAVVDAVRNGTIPEERINESVRRILAAKERYGLLNWQPLDPTTASERIDLAGHEAVIEELFQKGTSVAFDRNGLIPVSDGQRVAIVYPATRIQVANECGQYRPDISWVGVSDSPSDEELGWARDAAGRADVAIVFTQNADENPQQGALVNALSPEKTVVTALFSPYDITRFPGIAAYMVTYSPARPAVPAACGILFDAIPATGRLAVELGYSFSVGLGG